MKIPPDDAIYFDCEEELSIKLERAPTYEEVEAYIQEKFKITPEEEKEFYERRYFGE